MTEHTPATPLPLKLSADAARKLYKKDLSASSIVRSLRNGGHDLHAVAHAVKYFPEMDAMTFSDAWCGTNALESYKARGAFLDAKVAQ